MGDDDDEEKKDDVDMFQVKDVCDIGGGVPLFSHFELEDWELFKLRFELYLLVASFKKDVGDDERPGMHETHIGFYFNKYFKKQLIPKMYGKDTIKELLDYVKDTAEINASNGVLVCKLLADSPTEVPEFVKMQEEHRRDRQRRID